MATVIQSKREFTHVLSVDASAWLVVDLQQTKTTTSSADAVGSRNAPQAHKYEISHLKRLATRE